MKKLNLKPDIQVWVCKNTRPLDGSLMSCKHNLAEDVYCLLKEKIGHVTAQFRKQIWVNYSLCQGSCSNLGVSLVIEPLNLRISQVTLVHCDEVTAAITTFLLSNKKS